MKAVKGVRRGEDIREVSGKYDVTIYTVYRSLRKAEEGDVFKNEQGILRTRVRRALHIPSEQGRGLGPTQEGEGGPHRG